MAENIEALILPIGADPRRFDKSIKDVKDAYKSLQKTIEQTPFNFVTDEQRRQLEGLKRTFETLQGTVNNTNFDKFNQSSKDARTAATSLNLAIQDLPFGFIAIQNNLPALFNSFNKLREESNGVTGAISAIVNQLKGPAGLFLAYTSAISLTTYLTQKYGSLSAAYDALFTSTSAATVAQREYNKELKEAGKNLGNELTKVDILAKGIANENASREERLSYFYQAKKEVPDLLAGLNEENVLTAKGIKILQANAAARKSFLDLQVKSQAIGKVLNENYSKEADLQAKIVEQEQIRDKAITSLKTAQEGLNKATDSKTVKLYNSILNQAQKRFDIAQRKISGYKEELNGLQNVQSEYSDDLDRISKGTGEYYKNVETLNNGLKEEKERSDKAAKAARDLAKARAEQFKFAGDIRSLRNQDFLDFDPTLKPIKKIDAKGYVESFAKSINEAPGTTVAPLVELLFPEKEFKRLSDIWSKINADTAPKLEEFKNNIRDALINKELTTGVKTTYDDVEKAVTDAVSGISATLSADAQITQNFANAVMRGANEYARLQEQIKEFDKVKDTIESNLTRPFRDFFDTLLDEGKVTFASFEQLIKDSLKRILSQAIATGLAQLFASLLSGGGTVAVSKIAGAASIARGLSDVGKIGGIFRRVAAPSFGGVSGGPLQMAGAVNLSLRGSDLVGSINRTNATINRVG